MKLLRNEVSINLSETQKFSTLVDCHCVSLRTLVDGIDFNCVFALVEVASIN